MDTADRTSLMPSGEEMERLRALVPLHTLPDEALNQLAELTDFQTVSRGEFLFREGDTDHENIYLLKGTVLLMNDGRVVDSVKSEDQTARFPLAHQLPRAHSAKAKNKLRIVRIDSRRLSEVVAQSRTVDYQVDDFSDATDDDWMSMLLQSRVLQQVPASNIQQVMMRVEKVEVTKDEDLIRQGDPGDYYYMLTRGRAVVRRDNGDGAGMTELATLGPGDAFGEEALLSDNPRNSTVTMLKDGEVLRLGKESFLDLIQNPLLDHINRVAAQAKVDAGALWLDLRGRDAFDAAHFSGAINFPFESLRYQAGSLAPDRHYVLYSDAGGRATASAFLLKERGFDVSVLDESVNNDSFGDPAADRGALELAEVEPISVDAAVPGDGHAAVGLADGKTQKRIEEAETRAKELELRLQEAQRDRESVVASREQDMHKVQAAVDQAKRKVLESEELKQAALQDREQAYAEMERLTGSLEALEQERSSLQDRMSEIEGLDAEMQKRLAKAERELIGERERAESAHSSLEELSDRLAEVLSQREEEREQNARERGELKEALTALQLDLELAHADLEELRQADKGSSEADAALLAERDQAMAAGQAQLEALRSERDALSEDVERLNRQLQDASSERAATDADAQRQSPSLAQLNDELETACAELRGSREQLRVSQRERDEARSALAELEASHADQTAARDVAEAGLQGSQDELESVRREHEQELAALRASLQTLQSEYDEIQARLVELETAEVADAEQAQPAAADDSLQDLRRENEALVQRLEEREMALNSAREEQLELINALDTAAGERESLQFAVNQREEEKARIADLENSVDELTRRRDQELLAHEQALNELNGLLDTTQAEVERLQQQIDDGATPGEKALIEQRDALLTDLALRESEVDHLRGVIEEHVAQIQQAQDGGGDDDLAALRTELEMVREQAIRDVAQMREQLAAAETQKRRLQEADGREAVSLESMRQQIEGLETSLAGRQQELAEAEDARHMLEDEIEDGHRQLDQLGRELEKVRLENEENARALREAESAREQLQDALKERKDGDGDPTSTDLRDDRLHGAEPLDIEGGKKSRGGLWLLLGAVAALGGVEAYSMLNGHGELFSLLARLSGQ